MDVSLKPYTENHIEKTVYWLNQSHLQKTFCMRDDITVQSHRAWLVQNKEVLKWAIYDKEDYVGNLFCFLNKKHHSGYFQIYLGEIAKQGKQIGRKAMTLFLNHAFVDLKLNRVWMHCFQDNIRALNLYKKLGFRFEGTERESLFIKGKFISQDRYAILQHEWLLEEGGA